MRDSSTGRGDGCWPGLAGSQTSALHSDLLGRPPGDQDRRRRGAAATRAVAPRAARPRDRARDGDAAPGDRRPRRFRRRAGRRSQGARRYRNPARLPILMYLRRRCRRRPRCDRTSSSSEPESAASPRPPRSATARTTWSSKATTRSAATARPSSSDGFVWDYSGHFFHFKHPEIEAWLRERMPGQDVRTVEKQVVHRLRRPPDRLSVPEEHPPAPAGRVHRVPPRSLLRAHAGGGRRAAPAETNFKEMLYARFGRGIAEKFLIPYNEKLYACDLGDARQRRDGPVLPARRPRRHHPQHEGRRQRAATTRRSPIPRAARSST